MGSAIDISGYFSCMFDEGIVLMEKNEDSNSPSWGASFIMQTTEDIARAVYSSKDDSGGGHLQKLQNQVFRVLKGLSQPTEEKSAYNPEVLTTQKRQWASFQMQALVCFCFFVFIQFYPHSSDRELLLLTL